MGRRIEVGMWRAGKGNPDLKKTATDHPKTNATDRFSGTKSTAFMGFAFDFGVLVLGFQLRKRFFVLRVPEARILFSLDQV